MWLVALTAVFCFGLTYVIARGVLVCTAVHLGSRGNYAAVTDSLPCRQTPGFPRSNAWGIAMASGTS